MPKLPVKQQIFVREYLKDKNGGRAYRAAYGEKKGSDQSAARLLRTAKVAEAIERGLAKLAAKIDFDAERTLKRIAEFAFTPVTPQEIKSSKGINVLKATEMLAKHFKLLTDITQLQNPDGKPLVVLTMPANSKEAVTAPPPAPKEGDGRG